MSSHSKKVAIVVALIASIGTWILFLGFQAQGIFSGDSGDLVTAAVTRGVAHPPGYPLYTLLGWILSKLAIFTPAWRVGILSSFSHAVVVGLVCYLCYRLTKQIIAGVFAGLALVGNYVFFLYSTTAEVFALLDLFVITLTMLTIVLYERRNAFAWYALSFVTGLSLTHHHLILFLLPAISVVLWQPRHHSRKRASVNWPFLTRLIVLFLAGLLPYVYVPIVAHLGPIINWDRADSLSGFLRLITRQDYGTFTSAAFFGSTITERFLQIKAYGQFLFDDFGVVGLLLATAGFVWLLKTRKKLALFFLLAVFFLGPAFFFYAGFPLLNRFTLGTYERFLLPSYALLSVLIGVGFSYTTRLVRAISTSLISQSVAVSVWLIIIVLLFVAQIQALRGTLLRFDGLTTDQTADNLGRDVLSFLPTKSIVLLSRDTVLFTTQYVRYALGVRPDTYVLHAAFLSDPGYRTTVAQVFPDLSLSDHETTKVSDFIKVNRDRFPIFSNSILPIDEGWHWVQYGLLYRLTPSHDLPKVPNMLLANNRQWEAFSDPTKGLLARYDHLMLSDVKDVYAAARISLGKTLLEADLPIEAREQFSLATNLDAPAEASEAYMYSGLASLFLQECDKSLVAFEKARETALFDDPQIHLYESVVLNDCVGDEPAAKRKFSDFLELKKQWETPLER